MATVPVLFVRSDAIGVLGVTVGAADLGGAAGRDLRAIPLVGRTTADERQWCRQVIEFVSDRRPMHPKDCAAYHPDGGCARAGGSVRCAYHLPMSDGLFDLAAGWRYLAGVGVIHRSLWEAYGIPVPADDAGEGGK